MASVNQTRPHCVNQMGKTHSKPLAEGMAGELHGHGMLCVNRPLDSLLARLLIQSTLAHHSPYARKAVSNMAAPLVQRLREQQVIIRFLWSQGAKTVEIHRRMFVQ